MAGWGEIEKVPMPEKICLCQILHAKFIPKYILIYITLPRVLGSNSQAKKIIWDPEDDLKIKRAKHFGKNNM